MAFSGCQGIWENWSFWGYSAITQWSNTSYWAKLNDDNYLILDYTTDAQTTRNLVPSRYKKKGLIITYNNGTEQIIEQYKVSSVGSSNWINDASWQRLIDNSYLTNQININNSKFEPIINYYDYAKYVVTTNTSEVGFSIVNVSGISNGAYYAIDPLFKKLSIGIQVSPSSRQMLFTPMFNSDILGNTMSLGFFAKKTANVSFTKKIGLYVSTSHQGYDFTEVVISDTISFYKLENAAIPNTANLRIGVNLQDTSADLYFEIFGLVATTETSLFPRDYQNYTWKDNFVQSENILNSANVFNKIQVSAAGKLIGSSTYSCSELITLDKKSTEMISNRIYSKSFFDENLNFISRSTTALSAIPNNAKFVILTFLTTDINTCYCVYGNVLPLTKPTYNEKISSNWIPKISLNTLEGKKLTTYGDSITAGNLWQPTLAKLTGALVYVRGVGGTTICEKGSQAWFDTDGTYVGRPIAWGGTDDAQPSAYPNSVLKYSSMVNDQRVGTIPTDSDIVLLFGGANDSAILGTASDTPSDVAEATFAASYRRTIEKINARIPNVRIICIGMPYHGTADNVTGQSNSYNLRRDMIKTIANNYGLPFINLKEMCGWNALNYTTFLSDIVHPSLAGGERIGKVIAGYLNTIATI